MNQFLSGAERILVSSRDVTRALPRLARAMVPALADFCFIFLLRGDDVRCAGCAHTTSEGERLVKDLTRVYKIKRDDPVSTVAHVLRTGQAKLRRQIFSEAIAPLANLRVFTLHRQLDTRSALVVPIGDVRNVLGAISLCYAESGRQFTTQHTRTARRLADLTAVFLRKRARTGAAQPYVPAVQRRPLRVRARA